MVAPVHYLGEVDIFFHECVKRFFPLTAMRKL